MGFDFEFTWDLTFGYWWFDEGIIGDGVGECEEVGDCIGGGCLEHVDGGPSNVIVSSEDYASGVDDEVVELSSGLSTKSKEVVLAFDSLQ
ncbi:hypothetical protein L6452_35796 [Arctium lappa]|uniref:Uncharacterized protein n=1 Tax=Arctium lappa TaxID=4217 RepID=A0ACB8Y7F1_ARCLA|nr:hypothetical protein L6452_35796 [Arctium lappa]